MRNQDDVRIQYTTAPSRRERLETVRKEFKFRSRSKIIDIMVDDGTEKLESKIHIADETQAKEIRDGILQIAKDIAVIRTALLKTTSNINQIAKNSNIAVKQQTKIPASAIKAVEDAQREYDGMVQLKMTEGLYFETIKARLEKAKKTAEEYKTSSVDITEEEFANMNLDVDAIHKLIDELNQAAAAFGSQAWNILQ